MALTAQEFAIRALTYDSQIAQGVMDSAYVMGKGKVVEDSLSANMIMELNDDVQAFEATFLLCLAMRSCFWNYGYKETRGHHCTAATLY